MAAYIIEHQVAPFCHRHGIALVGYSPFAAGAFPPAPAGRAVLEQVAAVAGATPRQVALAFLLHVSRGFTIPKASQEQHLRENAAAAGLALAPEWIARLDAACPPGPDRGGVPTW